MSQAFTQTLAIVAAAILTVTSISSIVTVPPANAQAPHAALMMTELA